MYVDLPTCSDALSSILLADDASLFLEHEYPNILINQLIHEPKN